MIESILVANILVVLKENSFLTQILNLSKASILIEEGQIVATMEIVKEKNIIKVTSTSTTNIEVYNIKTSTQLVVPPIDLSKTDLSKQQKQQVYQLLSKYNDCFEDKLSTLEQLQKFEATLSTISTAKPIYQKDYR